MRSSYLCQVVLKNHRDPELGEVGAAVLHEHGDGGEAAVGEALELHGRADGADEADGVGDARLEGDGGRAGQLAGDLLPLPRGRGVRLLGAVVLRGAVDRRRRARLGPAGVGGALGGGEGGGGGGRGGEDGGGGEEEAALEEAREVAHGGGRAAKP